jgi:hypothetical protein
MPAQRNQPSTSQRLHTIWHETVLGIDSRTAR